MELGGIYKKEYMHSSMTAEAHILVITDDENSRIVRMLLRTDIIPITRRSIISAMDLLRHLDIGAIVIDKEHQEVDMLEFILNAKDVAGKIPILIPEQFQNTEDWYVLKNLGRISVYNKTNRLLPEQINHLLKRDRSNI